MPFDVNGGGAHELWDVTTALRNLARRIAEIAVDLQGVPLIGQALSSPLASISTYTSRVADALTYFQIEYDKLVKAIASGDISGSLEAALDLLFPGWRRLSSDPVGWMVDNFAKSYAFVPHFLSSPFDWLMDLLKSGAPSLGDLFTDPRGFVEAIVSDLLAEGSEFLSDPLGWLKAQLSELFGVDVSFWDDPIGNILKALLQWIVEHIIEFAKWVYPVAEKVLLYLFDYEV
jgi:hypothetical protein